MRKIAIFDECYDGTIQLEKDINDWIEEKKKNVIDIQVIAKNMGHIEYDYYNCPKDREEKHRENNTFWYAVVIYEE